ncbi:hypothetical protein GTP41_06715 [Pseudoduganella sp. DS3]|uniref:Uncharacterized protein n=1 Tax=Pseudoduganella guangdongensis TaxID=2692179 RepID=A0A6N9HEI1_9BURK|nr:hypothetical protein [Pseudoduganella guangdongensis]MYN01789.1 hypothetical protein [Pseudoduganella guangdongensis]
MTDALLLTDRLCDLTEMALQAYTKFEKATVYCTAKQLMLDFEEAGLPLAAHEKLESIQASILAAVEFAPPCGKNNPQCIVCARKEIAALRAMLNEKKRPEGRLQEHLH